MRYLFAVIVLVCFVGTAQAKDFLSLDLAENHIDITTGFDGADLIVYGTMQTPGDLIVSVRGPEKTMVVRRKKQVLGAWINTKSIEFRRVPGFYDYALSGPEGAFKQQDFLQEQNITLETLDFYPEDNEKPENLRIFREALLRNKQTQGLFLLKPKQVNFLNDQFFKTRFTMPANVPSGIYTINAYLLEGEKLIEKESRELRVGQVGFSARVYSFAQNNGLAYGLLAVALAALAGMLAYAVLRRD